jgi:5'-nucleotidase
MHSGTVGAALTAANFGLSGLAVSIGTGAPLHLEAAATVAEAALDWLATAPVGTVLNVNVPNRPVGQLRGVRWGRLAPFGTVRAALGERRDGRLQLELRDTEHELDPDTDTALVRAGWVSVTALVGVRAADEVDAPAAISRILSLAEAAS